MNLKQEIIGLIQETVKESPQHELYRDAIVGFSAAKDPLYLTLRDAMGNPMFTPGDLLPSAETVITYFIPYSLEVIKTVQQGGSIVQIWSDAYTLTNVLLSDIREELEVFLGDKGIRCAGEPPTMNYDPVNLTARWSHKSSAVIAGIATFGLNRLLITKSGTAGRVSSLVIDRELEPDQRPHTEYCLYKKNGSCGICMKRCPSGAIKPEGFDRFRCNAYLDGKNISEFEQGCSRCSSGPCGTKGFE